VRSRAVKAATPPNALRLYTIHRYDTSHRGARGRFRARRVLRPQRVPLGRGGWAGGRGDADWNRRRTVVAAAGRPALGRGLRKLHPGDFEAEVAGWLQREGWSVERRGGAGDGGIDLVARKRGETLAVQCKRYAERATVTASQVRELYGAAVAEGATGAMLVTTGRVSKVAREWCEGLPSGLRAVLVEGADLASIAAGGRLLR